MNGAFAATIKRCLPHGLHAALALLVGCNTGAPGAPPSPPSEPIAHIGPTVTAVSSDAGGLCLVHELSALFGEPMDPASIDDQRFVVTDGGVPVPGRVSLDATARWARFVPAGSAGFAPSRTIVAALLSGAGGVRSRAGQPMAEDHVWVFTTGWEPCDAAALSPPHSRTDFPPSKARSALSARASPHRSPSRRTASATRRTPG